LFSNGCPLPAKSIYLDPEIPRTITVVTVIHIWLNNTFTHTRPTNYVESVAQVLSTAQAFAILTVEHQHVTFSTTSIRISIVQVVAFDATTDDFISQPEK